MGRARRRAMVGGIRGGARWGAAALACIAGSLLAPHPGWCQPASVPRRAPPRSEGPGRVEISGEAKAWHRVTLTVTGPFARERDTEPNPFTDYGMTVRWTHESGESSYEVPGYFAADGRAGETSAEEGSVWRAHFTPDRIGRWTARIHFVRGPNVAVDDTAPAEPVAPLDGQSAVLTISPSDKTGRDFRAHGRLEYVGQRYLRFAASGSYFLKAGADSPETLLAYADFDGTYARRSNAPLKTWSAHLMDWQPGDPAWQQEKGKGLIGALNYLAEKGCNAVSFLTYNSEGDGDNVWPFVSPEDKLHYDCSKLDQWQVVLDHAQSRGLFLHFKLQETENDDQRTGAETPQPLTAPLDGGRLGIERKLYLRELVARFGYELALNWNLGEENSQTTAEQRAMAQYLRRIDPYRHPIVLHTFPNQQDQVYTPLVGDRLVLSGVSLQNPWDAAHRRVLKWVTESEKSGHAWVVTCDEQNPASQGVPPDVGYMGTDGIAHRGDQAYDRDSIRKATLWGTLLAGGAGVEYYFGYGLPQNDLLCEDFRSRDASWDYCRIALEFFHHNAIPFHEMHSADHLVGNPEGDNRVYCFCKPGELYLVYVASGDEVRLDLSDATGMFRVAWFNPRTGGGQQDGSVTQIAGGEISPLGTPPADVQQDWLAVVQAVGIAP